MPGTAPNLRQAFSCDNDWKTVKVDVVNTDVWDCIGIYCVGWFESAERSALYLFEKVFK